VSIVARTNLDVWIPEETGSDVLTTVQNTSVAEATFRREPMATDTKTIPRDGGVDVAVTPKGTAYTENAKTDDEITLKTRKFTGLLRIAEEDIADIPRDIISAKQQAWASTYARRLDFSCFSNTAAEDGLAVPFTSMYRALSTADASVGYTANANLVKTAGAVTYDKLSDLLGLLENDDYFEGITLAAHTSFKGTFRKLKDNDGRPILVESNGNAPDNLFGYPIKWSPALKTGTDVRVGPAASGNPLFAAYNSGYSILGVRSGPEFAVVNGFTGASALTDEALVKARSRRAYRLGNPRAAAMLEVTAAA
jgi:HK97 family phage major capsid protein